MKEKKDVTVPGDGIRSLRSTMLFRAVNYELYVKPNKGIMLFGIIAIIGCSGYIYYMRKNAKPYYMAVGPDGTLTAKKSVSRWDD